MSPKLPAASLPPTSLELPPKPGRGVGLVRRVPFFWRLLIFAGVLIVVVNGFATFVAIQSLRARLASELLAVVASIAPLIDGDLHELMGVDERGEPAPAEEFE